MNELVVASLASFAAGFVNSIAGGGGLVSIPILFGLFPAAPAATLFGTNKAAMVWGTLWASGAYAKRVRLPWTTLGPALVAALVGGFVGAWLVTQVPSDWLRRAVPFMLAAVLAYTIAVPNLGQVHAPRHEGHREAAIGTVVALVLGLYDGFFGPGTGSFFIFGFVRLLGFDFLNAVASAKVLNTATNLASLALFAWCGNVWWPFVLPMAVANVAGSWLGTRLALAHGSRFIRWVFLVATAALILKSVVDASVGVTRRS
jgi:uncharacterized membrane protein YfcA